MTDSTRHYCESIEKPRYTCEEVFEGELMILESGRGGMHVTVNFCPFCGLELSKKDPNDGNKT